MNEKFEQILRPHLPSLGTSPLTSDTELAAAGLDSLGTVSLLVDLEEGFNTFLPDNLVTTTTFRTAGSLWAAVMIASGQE